MALASALALGARAQQAAPEPAPSSSADLAKQLSNPIADLVSVPFQFNWEQGVGYQDATRTVLNVQPVVPFSLNDKWNLIGRWIMPFVSQPALTPGSEPVYGLSDVLFSAFFAPKSTKSGLIWGIGPAAALPMSDDPRIGSGQWSVGPTGVVLKTSGPWTYGVLANQLWSFKATSDADRPKVNRTFVQPFLSYTTPHAVSFVVQSEATYDHEAASGDKWTFPINFQVSQVTRFGPFPFSVLGGWGYFVESPDIGPDRKIRIAFTILLPRGK
ncbi:MAG: transporter [Gemmatimonadaceae bacterium]